MWAVRLAGLGGWVAGVAGLILLAGAELGLAREPAPVNRSLKILYAGRSGSDRGYKFFVVPEAYLDR